MCSRVRITKSEARCPESTSLYGAQISALSNAVIHFPKPVPAEARTSPSPRWNRDNLTQRRFRALSRKPRPLVTNRASLGSTAWCPSAERFPPARRRNVQRQDHRAHRLGQSRQRPPESACSSRSGTAQIRMLTTGRNIELAGYRR